MMRSRLRLILASLAAVILLAAGCSIGFLGGGKRPANVELILLSQGSLNGDLAPCG